MRFEEYHAFSDELASALLNDREAQIRGDHASIGRGYDYFDGRIPRDATAESSHLSEALCFWDYWIDARNHDWTAFYEIAEGEWPALAEHVADALRKAQNISAPAVLRLVT